jgi:predicted NBD/HSP70 family sugar kinase
MRIGVDLGGTKIEAIALGERGEVLGRRRVETPSGDYAGTVRAVEGLVAALEHEAGRRGSIGVATPGAISPATGTIKNANSVCLNGKPLHRDLEEALGRRVRLANDADCFALSEATDGAAAGARTVFGVILGTGVGGGIVVDGHVVTGPNAIGGEWGHNPMPWPSPSEWPGVPCYCGRTGCIETVLSGPGMSRDHRESGGERLEASEIAVRSAAGDAAARGTLSRYEERLARALASVLNLLDPDVVVLGGGLSNVRSLYETVPALWGAWVFSDRVDTRLVPPKHGDSSGVRGAAWLWPSASGRFAELN